MYVPQQYFKGTSIVLQSSVCIAPQDSNHVHSYELHAPLHTHIRLLPWMSQQWRQVDLGDVDTYFRVLGTGIYVVIHS